MNTKMRQLIIARKDLQMSPGKLAAQVSHGSIAFLTNAIRTNYSKWISSDEHRNVYYSSELTFDADTFENWICGMFIKTVCEAKNKNQLLKAIEFAEELGLVDGEDFFLIKDACLTELKPEEIDENGVGRVITCIGFRPLPDEIAKQISKRFQLYR